MKLKQIKGITLISLVITIIVLLILAGITINLTIGQDGIITMGQRAGQNYIEAEEREQNELAKLYEEMIGKELPENSKENPQEAGTIVKIPEKWISTTPAYVSTEDGGIVKQEVQLATVTAVATGEGETVPVPHGFYYVGGTISTGVVISDNKADQNKYANYTPEGEVKEGIPSGVAYNEDGTVNEELSQLKGNQFVWIPVTAEEYTKEVWKNGSTNLYATYETQTNTAELPQIEKYGGFYVGRYEAGTSDIELSTGVNFAAQNTADGWQNSKFSIRDGLNQTATGNITSKAGEIPYYHADYETALKLSNRMYQTDYVQSGLVTGTMWDAMMKFIAGNDETIVTQSTWGNYNNTSSYVTYTVGKGKYAKVDGGTTSAFTKSNGSYNYGIKTTAISEDVKKNNLYDIAGNLWEWTQEAAYYTDAAERYMLRGGSFTYSYSGSPACYRYHESASCTNTASGFRPALYIK